MQCKNCGATIRNGESTCPTCGSAVIEGVQNYNSFDSANRATNDFMTDSKYAPYNQGQTYYKDTPRVTTTTIVNQGGEPQGDNDNSRFSNPDNNDRVKATVINIVEALALITVVYLIIQFLINYAS